MRTADQRRWTGPRIGDPQPVHCADILGVATTLDAPVRCFSLAAVSLPGASSGIIQEQHNKEHHRKAIRQSPDEGALVDAFADAASEPLIGWLIVVASAGHGIFDLIHARSMADPGVPT